MSKTNNARANKYRLAAIGDVCWCCDNTDSSEITANADLTRQQLANFNSSYDGVTFLCYVCNEQWERDDAIAAWQREVGL